MLSDWKQDHKVHIVNISLNQWGLVCHPFQFLIEKTKNKSTKFGLVSFTKCQYTRRTAEFSHVSVLLHLPLRSLHRCYHCWTPAPAPSSRSWASLSGILLYEVWCKVVPYLLQLSEGCISKILLISDYSREEREYKTEERCQGQRKEWRVSRASLSRNA